jgi:hypothetical protein
MMMRHFLLIELPTDLNPSTNPSVIFFFINGLMSDPPLSLPHFFFFLYFSLQQIAQPP